MSARDAAADVVHCAVLAYADAQLGQEITTPLTGIRRRSRKKPGCLPSRFGNRSGLLSDAAAAPGQKIRHCE